MARDQARISPKKNLTNSTSIQTAVFRLVLYLPVLCLVLMAYLQVESYSRKTLCHKKTTTSIRFTKPFVLCCVFKTETLHLLWDFSSRINSRVTALCWTWQFSTSKQQKIATDACPRSKLKKKKSDAIFFLTVHSHPIILPPPPSLYFMTISLRRFG